MACLRGHGGVAFAVEADGIAVAELLPEGKQALGLNLVLDLGACMQTSCGPPFPGRARPGIREGCAVMEGNVGSGPAALAMTDDRL